MRKLIIFGNGLGRALDNGYYDLEVALDVAWRDPMVLDDDQRRLIRSCLKQWEVIDEDDSSAPKREDELDRLQRVLAACDEIAKYEPQGGPGWLSEEGKRFPYAIRGYVHRAATYFHEGEYLLPDSFTGPLLNWIVSYRGHVATLNYDELLYRAFIGTDAFNRYNCLLDGFVPHFDSTHLDRYYPARQAYYLHLHGSPLYYTAADGTIYKSALRKLPELHGHSSSHLVLTHVRHKASVINASPLLREYWRRLDTAMSEVNGLVLFGYGGGDLHLNSLIGRRFHDKQIEIVERDRPEYSSDEKKNARFQRWERLLGVRSVLIWWHSNILQHRIWDYVKPKE